VGKGEKTATLLEEPANTVDNRPGTVAKDQRPTSHQVINIFVIIFIPHMRSFTTVNVNRTGHPTAGWGTGTAADTASQVFLSLLK
jgi:hypothetical protein